MKKKKCALMGSRRLFNRTIVQSVKLWLVYHSSDISMQSSGYAG